MHTTTTILLTNRRFNRNIEKRSLWGSNGGSHSWSRWARSRDARVYTCKRLHDNYPVNVYKKNQTTVQTNVAAMTKFDAKKLRIN